MKKPQNKSPQRRKLILQRETVALLTAVQLKNVVGGSDDSIIPSCSPTDPPQIN